jgi:hypothetical protein
MHLDVKIKLLLALIFATFTMSGASADDGIVVLTWEQGLEQSVTIGGQTDGSLWEIELRGPNGKTLDFNRSTKNSAGYFLYRIAIPENYPKGRYEVYASTINRPEQLISYVDIVENKGFNPFGDVKKFGYLSTVAFAIFTAIATARREDFRTVALKKSREANEADEDKSDPASINFKDNLVELEERGIIDRLGYGRIGWIARLDAIRFTYSNSFPRFSPLAARYISDGSWFQAIFGPLALLFPIAGIATGVAMAMDTDMTKTLVPTSITLVLIGLAIGICDALAGLLVASTYIFWALATGNLVNAIDLRTALGVALIFSAPVLLVGNIRPLRREPETWKFTERLVDVVVVGALSIVVVKALFTSLDSLSQQQTLLSTYAGYFSLIAGVLVALRYIIEDITEKIAPARLNYLIPTSAPGQEFSYYFGAISIKVSIFILFLIGFFGISWQLIAGVLLLAVMELMKYFKDSWPNSPFLYQLLPSGVPQIVLMAFIGVATTSWAESLPLIAEDRAKTIFLIIAVPSLILTVLKMFGRNPRPEDVKWYCRSKMRFFYYLFGPAMVALALGLQLGVI